MTRLLTLSALLLALSACATPDCPKIDPCRASGYQDWNADGLVNAEDFAIFVRECG